ncbi:MAG: hybrid sensor histidine kinase/response regulator, partial [Pseudomonas sp.]|nr:hybrid sensor histidine kinase/response regulator [Pseudomonas sp.]
MKFEKNTELDQANLRIIIAAIAVVYMVVLGFLPGQRFDTYLPVIT